MIQLFPREPAACEWCGERHSQASLCTARAGLTRRSFFFLASSAVVALLAPKLPAILDPVEYGVRPNGLNFSQFDAILKEVYAPAIVQQLNEEPVFLTFMRMTPAERRDYDRKAEARARMYRLRCVQLKQEARIARLEAYGVSTRRLMKERARLDRLREMAWAA